MEKLDIPVSQVKKLLELVDTHNLEELTVEEGDLSISVKGRAARAAADAAAHQAPPSATLEPQADAHETPEEELLAEVPAVEPEEEADGSIVDISAPLVGVFYRSPAPDAPPFVDVGDMIEVGTEVGLIEAMKVFSPIPSEVVGEVIDIPGENGKLVQQGDVLVRVKISEEEVQA